MHATCGVLFGASRGGVFNIGCTGIRRVIHNQAAPAAGRPLRLLVDNVGNGIKVEGLGVEGWEVVVFFYFRFIAPVSIEYAND